MDLHDDPAFQSLGVEVLSLAPDSLPLLRQEVQRWGIRTPLLHDAGNRVATLYDVMQWAVPSGEPGHTFVLVDKQGAVRWIQDYGAPQNGGLMYVEPDVLYKEVSSRL